MALSLVRDIVLASLALVIFFEDSLHAYMRKKVPTQDPI
jgi:hypothetical protein